MFHSSKSRQQNVDHVNVWAHIVTEYSSACERDHSVWYSLSLVYQQLWPWHGRLVFKRIFSHIKMIIYTRQLLSNTDCELIKIKYFLTKINKHVFVTQLVGTVTLWSNKMFICFCWNIFNIQPSNNRGINANGP